MDITDVTQDMVDRSQARGGGALRVSDPDGSSITWVILKYNWYKVPIEIIASFSDTEITHDEAIAEVAGSIWQD